MVSISISSVGVLSSKIDPELKLSPKMKVLEALQNLEIERCSDYSRVIEVVARAFVFLQYVINVLDDGTILRFPPNVILVVYSNGRVECYEM